MPWAALAAHPAFTPSHLSNRSPCAGTPPDRSRRLQAVIALGEPSRNRSCIALHQETYRVKGCQDFFPLSSPLSSHSSLPSVSLCPTPFPRALLRFAEEFFLGRAVSLQCCLLTRSSLHPRSLSQPSSRGPAQDVTFSAPHPTLPSLQVSLGLSRNLLGTRVK